MKYRKNSKLNSLEKRTDYIVEVRICRVSMSLSVQSQFPIMVVYTLLSQTTTVSSNNGKIFRFMIVSQWWGTSKYPTATFMQRNSTLLYGDTVHLFSSNLTCKFQSKYFKSILDASQAAYHHGFFVWNVYKSIAISCHLNYDLFSQWVWERTGSQSTLCYFWK